MEEGVMCYREHGRIAAQSQGAVMNFRMKPGLPLLLGVVICAWPLCATADFFVDKGNPAASDSNPGTEASPWLTIGKANSTLTAGQTVWIKAGVYTTGIAPANSGTSANRITYARFGNDSVTISNVSVGINLVGDDSIKVDGITFKNCDAMLWIDGGTNNLVQNCAFGPMRNFVPWAGSQVFNGAKFNVVTNCVFFRHGNYDNLDDNGAVVEIGDEYSSTDTTSYNLFINSEFYSGGHHVVGLHGNHNILKNCYLHNEVWNNGYGNRALYSHGSPNNTYRCLAEGNRIAWTADPPDNDGSSGWHLHAKRYIVRRNSFYRNSLAGIQLSVTPSYSQSPEYNMIYHNTFYTNAIQGTLFNAGEKNSAIALANYDSTYTVKSNVFKNNLFWLNPRPIGTYKAFTNEQVWAGNLFQTANPLFIDIASAQSPANRNLPNLSLTASSPAIDAGAPLTTILSPTGSGTSFTVDNADYFMDGWGLISGDRIQLFGTTQTAVITSVNYTTRSITVDRTLSWTQNQGVALAYEGAAPDVGAYELQNQNSPPVITSSPTATGTQGLPFTYQITAINGPTSFGASGLPAGLTVATNSGVISGVPPTSDTFVCTISASNPYGTGSANLTINIGPPVPLLGVNPTSLNFPEIGVGQSADLQFFVTNAGVGTLSGTASATAPFGVVGGGNYALSTAQVWPVTVRYSPVNMGTHNGRVIFTGGAGSTNTITGQAFPVLGWTFSASGGLVSAPFTISGGYLVQNIETDGDPTTSGAGRAVYGFVITNSGNYLISAYVDAPNTGADSFHVNVDAEPVHPTMIWDIPLTVGFERRTVSWRGGGGTGVPQVFTLTAGVHKLILRGREPGVRVDRIEITSSGPTGVRPGTPQDFRFVSGE
jgi:hypothetical protein